MERAADEKQRAFRDALAAAGVLVPSSVKGVYGKGPSFVATFNGVDRFVTDAGAVDRPEVYRFPPVFPRDNLVRTDYLRAFPDLMGSIHGFEGGSREHAALLRDLDGGADWSAGLTATDLVLLPAACYPLYPAVAGPLPDGGRLFDVLGSCFRHEPSDDPARMQAFHQHEFVHIGSPDSARAFRDDWLARSQQMMSDLGLDISAEIANDPFFGRGGSMLAANQRESALKFEVLAPAPTADHQIAIVSCNCHLDHLTVPFGITRADGGEAHSACVGFGIERIVLALFAGHGLDADRWPAAVRDRLRT
jgi:seryl-tRNA synthetase